MIANQDFPPTQAAAKRDLVESLITGLDVILAFDDQHPRLSASDLAKNIGLSRAAARRYLITLAHAGMAGSDGKNFWLTPKVLSLGHSYLGSARLPRTVTPFLQRLTQQIQESTNFAVLDGHDVVYVARAAAPKLTAVGLETGSRLPAYTTAAGRVALASAPPEVGAAWFASVEPIAFTAHTQTNKSIILADLNQIRQQGFALTENQYEIGLRGLAVPLRSRNGQIAGALSVSMSQSTCTSEEALKRFLPPLQATALALMSLL
jgi:IclR family transcriptional regulator, pca regulon regulatory protein